MIGWQELFVSRGLWTKDWCRWSYTIGAFIHVLLVVAVVLFLVGLLSGRRIA